MQSLCTMPGCKDRADTTFALLPLCQMHNDSVLHEALDYYSKHPNAGEKHLRPLYRKIDSLIPWSRKRMGKFK